MKTTGSESQDLLQVTIPYDPLFEGTEDIIFASSFTSETGSELLLTKRQQSSVEQSELLSGQVSISARAATSSFKAKQDKNFISEIEVKDLSNPIKIEIPLTREITNP